jgi:hypothetical protein
MAAGRKRGSQSDLVIFEAEEVHVVEGHAEQEWIIQETVKRASFCRYFLD